MKIFFTVTFVIILGMTFEFTIINDLFTYKKNKLMETQWCKEAVSTT